MSDEASTTRFVRRFYLLALLGLVVGSRAFQVMPPRSRGSSPSSSISIGPGATTTILHHEERRIVASPAKQITDAAPGLMLGPVYRVLQVAVG